MYCKPTSVQTHQKNLTYYRYFGQNASEPWSDIFNHLYNCFFTLQSSYLNDKKEHFKNYIVDSLVVHVKQQYDVCKAFFFDIYYNMKY